MRNCIPHAECDDHGSLEGMGIMKHECKCLVDPYCFILCRHP